MAAQRVTVSIIREGAMCAVPVPFDPKAAFGRVRAPVRVTLNGYTYRSTIAAMGGGYFIPLRKTHREAAGLQGGETLEVLIEADEEPRTVQPPPDLQLALQATPPAWERWQELSFTHQREYVQAVEEAKKPETRSRRIAQSVSAIAARAARRR
jgi:hypothetical protein